MLEIQVVQRLLIWYKGSVNTRDCYYDGSSYFGYWTQGGTYGVYGSGSSYGLYGTTATGGATGVYGINSYSGSSNGYGVYGQANNAANFGYGVYGSGGYYGVYGYNYSSGYSGYFGGYSYGFYTYGPANFAGMTSITDYNYSTGSTGQFLQRAASGVIWATVSGGGSSEWYDAGTYLYPNDYSSFRVYENGTYLTYISYSSPSGNQRHYVYDSVNRNGSSYSDPRCNYYGYNYYGSTYAAAVFGRNYGDYDRSSGVLGIRSTTYWGSLGYNSASPGGDYGGYFYSSYSSTAGRRRPGAESPSDLDKADGIGIGAWGGLMGANILGNVYGLYLKGDRIAQYTDGNTFANGIEGFLQDVGEDWRAVAYTNVSTDVSINSSGTAKLSTGSCRVEFDPNFAKLASDEIPIVVTVSPLGSCNGLYISEIDELGFTVIENNAGYSDISFTWIAIARRKGYEITPTPPQEVLDAQFDANMTRVFKSDGVDAPTGEEIRDESTNSFYFEGGDLKFDRIQDPRITPEYLSLKNEFGDDMLSRSWDDWDAAFKAIGEPGCPVSRDNYMSEYEHANSAKKTAFFDSYGNQIPAEWVEELRAEGVEMFTYEQAQARRKQAYLDNARAVRKSKDPEFLRQKEEDRKREMERNRPPEPAKTTGNIEAPDNVARDNLAPTNIAPPAPEAQAPLNETKE